MESATIYAMPNAYWLLPVAITGLAAYIFIQPGHGFSRLLMALVSVWIWYTFLTTPHRIELTSGEQLVLDSVSKQTRLNLSDISVINRQGRRLVIRHRAGKINVTNMVSGFDRLAGDLRRTAWRVLDVQRVLAG